MQTSEIFDTATEAELEAEVNTANCEGIEEAEFLDTPPEVSEVEVEASETEDTLESDLDELSREFGELSGVGSISEIDGALRYGELRELGLSPREAYLATRPKQIKERSARAHLTPAAPSAVRRLSPTMPHKELKIARELFENLSDSEIEALYKKVTRV